MPATITTTEPNPNCLVGLTPKQISGEQCPGASRTLWDFVELPVGSAATYADPLAADTTWLPDIPGQYRVRFCCFYDYDTVPAVDYEAPPTDPFLGCPLGVEAGEEIYIPLLNCEDAAVVWSATGAFVSIAGDTSGATVTTDANNPGPISVTAECTTTDSNNQSVTTPVTCDFESHAGPLMCDVSPFLRVSANLCGGYCECVERTFIVKLVGDDDECESDVLCISVKDCPPTFDEECAA